jgi:hypothetical protein
MRVSATSVPTFQLGSRLFCKVAPPLGEVYSLSEFIEAISIGKGG